MRIVVYVFSAGRHLLCRAWLRICKVTEIHQQVVFSDRSSCITNGETLEKLKLHTAGQSLCETSVNRCVTCRKVWAPGGFKKLLEQEVLMK